ncbi:uncharacterized protein [Pseudochaenichthys georgianus]|uniref:Uncharacterized protein n=1 Tax=Chaenocephalus aceratus TaxID=36190 RepID=A0ACB9WNR1_CHAAC|nr:uncharacterized protein si:dkey-52l18.4 [Pseudochaenichthys georgianus]KAI4815442.1 hypothetical protein KUCAC02_005587 [Chaenocephalus aceratus]
MHYHLLSAISCLCLLHAVAEECSQVVLADRETLDVPAGGSLSLSCVVQHCGGAWTGDWIRRNSTEENLIFRHHVTKVNLSANQTKLILNVLNVHKSDEGSYGCSVTWAQDDTEQGNLKYVNVTAAVSSQRSVLHRILVCAAAALSLPVILGLARCLSSEVKPLPLPRTRFPPSAASRNQPHPAPQLPPIPMKRSTSSHKAIPMARQKTEVVYADISQDALRQPGVTKKPDQSTVYSSLRFS